MNEIARDRVQWRAFVLAVLIIRVLLSENLVIQICRGYLASIMYSILLSEHSS